MSVNTFPLREDVDTTMTFREFTLDFQKKFVIITTTTATAVFDLINEISIPST